MRFLFVNSVYGVRSTGKIIAEKCHELQREGHECVVAYGREAIDDDVEFIKIGTSFDYSMHTLMSRLFDNQGHWSYLATKAFLRKATEYKPDVLWLHNIHGYYLNYPLLFEWIKKQNDLKVYWTLHDCWAFTGHCAYFTMAKCEKWKRNCSDCQQKREYPKSIFRDNSKKNFQHKKDAFCGVNNLTLITPSKWLAQLTRESFLRTYSVKVINNKIDYSVFKPTPSTFRDRYGLCNKFIVLGVAVGWETTKGLPDILNLRKILGEEYVIVLVGATKKQIESFPDGIIGIEKTKDQVELAQIYTAADVFINPTHQDNYPTVNLEARACGTPVITYNVGGSPESAGYEYIIEESNIEEMKKNIELCCRNKLNNMEI